MLVRRQQRSAGVVSHRAVGGPFRLHRRQVERQQSREIIGGDTPARQCCQPAKLESMFGDERAVWDVCIEHLLAPTSSELQVPSHTFLQTQDPCSWMFRPGCGGASLGFQARHQ